MQCPVQQMRDRVVPLNGIAARFLHRKCDTRTHRRSIAPFQKM